MTRDPVAPLELPALGEGLVDPAHVRQVLPIHRADDAHRGPQVALGKTVTVVVLEQLPRRFERVVEAHPIQSLELAQLMLTVGERFGQLRILAEQLLGTLIELQVARRTAEMLA